MLDDFCSSFDACNTILTTGTILLSRFFFVGFTGRSSKTKRISFAPLLALFRFVLLVSVALLDVCCLLAFRFVPIDDGDESCVDGKMWPTSAFFLCVGMQLRSQETQQGLLNANAFNEEGGGRVDSYVRRTHEKNEGSCSQSEGSCS